MPPSTTTPTTGFTWEEVVRDPLLRDLPYKIETNARGQIIMSPPPKIRHKRRQDRIRGLLKQHLRVGEALVEYAVHTANGTKVMDVMWASTERVVPHDEAAAAPIAPEICVEVRSPSNTDAEMEAKRALYFEAGAEEVWICDEDGAMTFYDADGEMDASHRAPAFPAHVEL